ncbi:hypothetical protein CSOJ01_14627 [Colletotrichum sojae]|uniref:Uncharacterized protein n=1 Tax=Colletotrichum sojae TaxID=2175907 RepID=A0A8H6IQ66_9PEZI|nr:hypothetical protein CSOJ01_14627 [Colletotrichum sojae]
MNALSMEARSRPPAMPPGGTAGQLLLPDSVGAVPRAPPLCGPEGNLGAALTGRGFLVSYVSLGTQRA